MILDAGTFPSALQQLNFYGLPHPQSCALSPPVISLLDLASQQSYLTLPALTSQGSISQRPLLLT